MLKYPNMTMKNNKKTTTDFSEKHLSLSATSRLVRNQPRLTSPACRARHAEPAPVFRSL